MSKVSMKVFLSSTLALLVITSCFLGSKQETKIGANDLVGDIGHHQFIESEHYSWYKQEIESYIVDTNTISNFVDNKEIIASISIKVFLGTWCSDSRREFPRFMKIVNTFEVNNIEVFGLDRNKKSAEGHEVGMDIHHVPTFIIYKNGVELNRIIETPVESLEKDLVTIINVKKYTPNHTN